MVRLVAEQTLKYVEYILKNYQQKKENAFVFYCNLLLNWCVVFCLI